jgi:hypothetical protein
MSDLPLGFGVAAKSTAECRHADPMGIVCFHQVRTYTLKQERKDGKMID